MVLAVDLGGSHVTCAVVVECSLLGKASFQIADHARAVDFDDLMKQVALSLKTLLQEIRLQTKDVAGIVIGFPGIVDKKGLCVTDTNQKYESAKTFDFAVWGREYFGRSVLLENDARLALIGEHSCGAAQGYTDATLITLGTGIGAAVILNDQPLRGNDGRAGCLGGHLPVQVGGHLCSCGNIGCAEAESATWALARIAKEMGGYQNSSLQQIGETLDFELLFTHADEGDQVAAAVLAHCYTVWGTLAVAILHAYAPQILLLGGGVMKRGEEILSPIRRYVDKYAWGFVGAQVQAAKLGSESALFGALARWQEVD